jgi:hypothetical protein
MKTFFLTFICIIMLTGCNDDDSSPAPFEPVTITPVLIGKGYTLDITITPGNLVISNQTQWDAFLISMGYVTDNFINTTIDFNTEQVIAIVDAPRGSTAFSVNIDTIVENEDNITVDFSLLNSGDGFTTSIIPYHIVKIPRSSKPVIFQ